MSPTHETVQEIPLYDLSLLAKLWIRKLKNAVHDAESKINKLRPLQSKPCTCVQLFETNMVHIPETQEYFIMSHFYIIIDGKNSISLNNVIWNKTIIQTVLSYFHHLLKTANKQ